MSQHIATRRNRVAKRAQYVVPNNIAILKIWQFSKHFSPLYYFSTVSRIARVFCSILLNIAICCVDMLARAWKTGQIFHATFEANWINEELVFLQVRSRSRVEQVEDVDSRCSQRQTTEDEIEFGLPSIIILPKEHRGSSPRSFLLISSRFIYFVFIYFVSQRRDS